MWNTHTSNPRGSPLAGLTYCTMSPLSFSQLGPQVMVPMTAPRSMMAGYWARLHTGSSILLDYWTAIDQPLLDRWLLLLDVVVDDYCGWRVILVDSGIWFGFCILVEPAANRSMVMNGGQDPCYWQPIISNNEFWLYIVGPYPGSVLNILIQGKLTDNSQC